jgi:hypothetical protein
MGEKLFELKPRMPLDACDILQHRRLPALGVDELVLCARRNAVRHGEEKIGCDHGCSA